MNLAAVNQFIGQPWAYPENDCWQTFRKASLAVFGVQVEAVAVPAEPHTAAVEAPGLFAATFGPRLWQRVDAPEPGCAVLFRNGRGNATHIGLYVEGGNVLHCLGGPNRAGSTRYDELRLLRRIYNNVEFYRRVPDNCH